MRQLSEFESDLTVRIDELETAIRNHRDQKGDDRCWLDDVEIYKVLPEGVADADLRLHCPKEMLENCKKYLAHRQNPEVPYISPQREIEKLEKENERLRAEVKNLTKYLEEK